MNFEEFEKNMSEHWKNPMFDFKQNEFANVSFGEKLGAGFLDDSFIAQGGVSIYNNAADIISYEQDDNFTDEAKKKILTDAGVHPDRMQSNIDRARNKEHLESMLPDILKRQHHADALDESTWNGFFYRGAAVMSDFIPLAIAGTATIPTAMATLSTSFGSRVAAGAVVETALEAGKRWQGERERSYLESAIAVTGGALGAGALGKSYGQSANQIQDIVMNNIANTANLTKSQMNKVKILAKEGKKDEANKIIEKQAKGLSDIQSESITAGLDRIHRSQNMGKMAYDALRVDMQHLTNNSPSASVSDFSKAFFQDPTLSNIKQDGTYLGNQAVELTSQLQANYYGGLGEIISKATNGDVFLANIGGIKKEKIMNIMGKVGHEKQFGSARIPQGDIKAATEAMARDLTEELNIKYEESLKIAEKAVKHSDSHWAKAHDILSNHNIAFQDGSIIKDPNYRPVQYMSNAMNKIFNRDSSLNETDIEQFWINAWFRKLDPKTLEKMTPEDRALAEGWIKTFVRRRFTPATETLSKELAADAKADEALDALLKMQGKTKLDEKTAGSLMQRTLDIDTTFEYKGIKYFDFIQTNEESFMIKYAREMGGRTSLGNFKYKGKREVEIKDEFGEVKTESLIDDVALDSDAKILEYMKKASDELDLQINSGLITHDKKMAELARMEHIFNNLTGRPTAKDPFHTGHKVVDILKNLTNAKLLGQVAFSMPAEIVTSAGFVGTKNLFQAVPEAKKVLSILRSGKINDDQAQEIFDTFSAGVELMHGVSPQRYTDEFSPDMTPENFLGKVHEFSERYASAIYLASGMKQITAVTQVATIMSMQREMMKFASTGSKSAVVKRMQKDLNISNEMLDRIAVQMNRYTENIQGGKSNKATIDEFISKRDAKINEKRAKFNEAEAEKKTKFDEQQKIIDEATAKLEPFREAEQQFNEAEQFILTIAKAMDINDGSPKNLNYIKKVMADADIPSSNLDLFMNRAAELGVNLEVDGSINWNFGGNLLDFARREVGNMKSEVLGDDYSALSGSIKRAKNKQQEFQASKFNEKEELSNIQNDLEPSFFNDQKQYIPKGSKVNKVNYDQWDDKEALDLMKQSMRTVMDMTVQMGHLQDTVGVTFLGNDLLTNTMFGKLFLSLKTYMIQAYTKQLGRNIATLDANKAMMLISQAAVLTMSTAVQDSINYAGTDKLEDRLKFENLIPRAMSKMSISSYVPAVLDTAYFAGTGETLGGNRYHKASDIMTNLFAPMTVINDAFKISSVPFKVLSGKPQEAGEALLGATTNLPVFNTARQSGLEALGDSKKERKKGERKLKRLREKLGIE